MAKFTGFLVFLAPMACWAHITHDQPSITSGLLHPFTGWDHMLALLAIGWLTWQQKTHLAMFSLPLAFCSGLTLGAFLGLTGNSPAAMEYGIATSLIALGICIALMAKAKFIWPLALVAGLFHGFAHGAEMPASSSTASYFAGFLICSTSLVLLGLCGHRYVSKSSAVQKFRHAVSTLFMLAGTLLFIGNL